MQKNITAQQVKFDSKNVSYLFIRDYTSMESVRLFSAIDTALKYLPCKSLPNGSQKIEVKEIRVIPVSRERDFLYNQSYVFGKKGDTAFFREEYIDGSFPRFQNTDKKALKRMISDFIEKLVLEAKLIQEINLRETMN